MAFDWTCPYCNRDQSVTADSVSDGQFHFYIGETALGQIGLTGIAIVCSSRKCKQVTVNVMLRKATENLHGQRFFTEEAPLLTQRLIPNSMAKPQPEYIPEPLREDYEEACKIRDLSPKAAATLARRCLQGMIRDFCGISKPTLFKEIDALRAAVADGSAPRAVSPESVDAIDNVRTVGNIGAHMESDISHIIPVDANEAQILIDLIEMLFDEWYVAQHRREERLANLTELTAAKQEQRTKSKDDQ